MTRQAVLAALLFPHLLVAQPPSPGPTGPRSVGITLARLDANSRIMISGPSVGRTRGRFRVDGDRVTLVEDGDERTFDLATIDSVWVRGNQWRAGAVAGGLVMAPLGALYGGLVAGVEGGDLVNFDTGGAILGGLVGAAIGAGIGAALGSTAPRWDLRFP